MSQLFWNILDKSFVIFLAAFAAIALSLFTIFHFLSFSQFGEPAGLTVFIVVACLLVGCYVLGFIVIAFFGLFVLAEFSHRGKK
jgi:Na+/H+-dicarboxylate symporter